jgi:uncharacterized protein GlcG (DUF336 family)
MNGPARRGELVLVRSVGLCPPGTFVRLDNGDTAIVLRRSEKANLPLVASIVDRGGKLLTEPRLHQTMEGKPRIQSALARNAVTVELNHRTMVRWVRSQSTTDCSLKPLSWGASL